MTNYRELFSNENWGFFYTRASLEDALGKLSMGPGAPRRLTPKISAAMDAIIESLRSDELTIPSGDADTDVEVVVKEMLTDFHRMIDVALFVADVRGLYRRVLDELQLALVRHSKREEEWQADDIPFSD